MIVLNDTLLSFHWSLLKLFYKGGILVSHYCLHAIILYFLVISGFSPLLLYLFEASSSQDYLTCIFGGFFCSSIQLLHFSMGYSRMDLAELQICTFNWDQYSSFMVVFKSWKYFDNSAWNAVLKSLSLR